MKVYRMTTFYSHIRSHPLASLAQSLYATPMRYLFIFMKKKRSNINLKVNWKKIEILIINRGGQRTKAVLQIGVILKSGRSSLFPGLKGQGSGQQG